MYRFWVLSHPRGMMTCPEYLLVLSSHIKDWGHTFPFEVFFGLTFLSNPFKSCQMSTIPRDNGQRLEQNPAPCWVLQSSSPQSGTSCLGPWHSSVTQLSTPTAFQARLEITDFILQWRFCHENKGIRNTLQFTLKWDYLQPWWGGYWVQLRLQCSWRTLDVKINSTKEINSKGIQCSRMHFTNKILTSNQEKRHHNLKPIQV